MPTPDPLTFSRHWVEAWNAHDLDRVLDHFHDDVVFTSPVAARLLEGSDGVLRGKAAVRAYWTEGLRRIPDLHFSVEAVYAGIDVLVISYRNQRGITVNEVLRFADQLVIEGHGTYPVDDPEPAGAGGR